MAAEVKVVGDIKPDVGKRATAVGVPQNSSRVVDPLLKWVGKVDVEAAIIPIPGGDGPVSFKIILDGLGLGNDGQVTGQYQP